MIQINRNLLLTCNDLPATKRNKLIMITLCIVAFSSHLGVCVFSIVYKFCRNPYLSFRNICCLDRQGNARSNHVQAIEATINYVQVHFDYNESVSAKVALRVQHSIFFSIVLRIRQLMRLRIHDNKWGLKN